LQKGTGIQLPELTPSPLHDAVLDWYDANARPLPWRAPDIGAWAVLVSEVMLQQTPVSRVLPAYGPWLRRWPTPSALAAEAPGEAIRQWGRLGYPRRALRLHEAATVIQTRHDGRVPDDIGALRTLPGVGAYTAAAVAAFAYGQRRAVLDTNVRRVLARVCSGVEHPGRSVSKAEEQLAESLLPEGRIASRWSVAVMELGALVCTARSPSCTACPIAGHCAWRLAGSPSAGPRRSAQKYEGTDRQARGSLLVVLRNATAPLPRSVLDLAWPDDRQRARALDSLLADGLVEPLADGRFRLPTLRRGE
jgi:A/G-specific adenine glycosylase